MAQLNSRGTQTRNRWDYYERSNGFATVWGSVVSGPVGAYLANNSAGAAALDIYHFTWSASVSTIVEVAFLLPPLVLSVVTPLESYVHPIQPDAAAPPGVVGMFSIFTSTYWTIKRYSAGSSGGDLSPIMGSYFVTLPPGWAIAVWTNNQPNPCELSMSVWFQEITDNIAPAP